MPRVVEIAVADAPELWRSVGFSVDEVSCRVGAVDLRLGARDGRGLVGWSLSGLASLELDGLPTIRQAFFRAGQLVIEVIEQPRAAGTPVNPDQPAKLWGLAFEVASLDRCARCLGERLGSPRDAVQPGRRIATLRRSAGLGVPVAFMTPEPARNARPAAPT